jgi:hypothetical protein
MLEVMEQLRGDGDLWKVIIIIGTIVLVKGFIVVLVSSRLLPEQIAVIKTSVGPECLQLPISSCDLSFHHVFTA